MEQWSARAVFWWAVTWLFRIGLVAAAVGCWVFLQRHNWTFTAAMAVAVVTFFQLQRSVRRLALGWIIDDNGERQKVESWSRGHAIFTPTTRTQRIVEEARFRDERRKELLWQGAGVLGLGVIALYAWPRIHSSDLLFMTLVLSCLFGGVLLLIWITTIWSELLYLGGWQDMRGAKVLDNARPQPGLEDVARQKVHGEGRVASQAEALALLNLKG